MTSGGGDLVRGPHAPPNGRHAPRHAHHAGALAATLVGTVTVQARESRSTDRQLRIKADPARETAGLRTFRKVDVASLPAATGKGSGYDPVLKRPDVNRSPAAPQGAVPAFPEQATSNGDPAITQATAFPGWRSR